VRSVRAQWPPKNRHSRAYIGLNFGYPRNRTDLAVVIFDSSILKSHITNISTTTKWPHSPSFKTPDKWRITLTSKLKKPHLVRKLLPARRSWSTDQSLHGSLQPPALSWEPDQRHTFWRLLWTWYSNPEPTRKEQTKHVTSATLSTPQTNSTINPIRWA